MNPTPRNTFSAGLMSVRVFAQLEDLAWDAALATQEYLQQQLARQETVSAIFACATSQVRFLSALIQLPKIDWSRITVFHMDEYLGINENHPASFRRFLRDHLVNPVQPGQVHYLAGDALEPIKECDRYAGLLQAQPIDLCCLGIGENGHLAFNDPPVADFVDPRRVKIVTLDEACRRQQVGEGCFPTLDSVPQYALTLTIPTLCAARKMVCIVPDQRKAMAVQAAIKGPLSTACPASFLRQQSHATLFLDNNSASLL
jgi:glucosamine-6-phosphate deaminase